MLASFSQYHRRCVYLCALQLSLTLNLHAHSLISAIDSGLKHNYPLESAQLSWLQSEHDQQIALASLLPAVTTSVSLNQQQTKPPATTQNSKNYRLRLHQVLFNPEKFSIYRQASLQQKHAWQSYKLAQQNFLLDTSTQYANVLLANNNIKYAQSALTTITEKVKQARHQLKVGSITTHELAEVVAQHARNQVKLIHAQQQLASDLRKLQSQTGLNFKKIHDLKNNNFPKSGQKLSQLLAQAQQQNPLIQQAKLNEKIQQQALSASISAFLPNISLNLQHSQSHLRQTAINNQSNSANISLDWTLSSGGKRYWEVKQHQLRRQQAQVQTLNTTQQVHLAIRDAYANLHRTATVIQQAELAVKAAKSYQQAQNKLYQAGATTLFELLNSIDKLQQDQADYAKSRYDYWLALLQIKFHTGSLQIHDIQQMNTYFTKPTALSNTTASSIIKP